MPPNLLLKHHAHIWVSDPQTLHAQLTKQLQDILCTNQSCTTCTICKQIETRQHPSLIYSNPENGYTLDDIDDILECTKFKLAPREHKFFIFDQAQQLSATCSNRLLKTIEEPHAGYHFIFLASRTDSILPTIISRCFYQEFKQQNLQSMYQEIMLPFTTHRFENPLGFIKQIEKLEIDHQISKDIIDDLISHFYQQLQAICKSSQPDITLMQRYVSDMVILQQQLDQLPAQGSSKLFWKNLYLTFHREHA